MPETHYLLKRLWNMLKKITKFDITNCTKHLENYFLAKAQSSGPRSLSHRDGANNRERQEWSKDASNLPQRAYKANTKTNFMQITSQRMIFKKYYRLKKRNPASKIITQHNSGNAFRTAIGDKIITYCFFLFWGITFGKNYRKLYSIKFLGHSITVM